MEEPRMTALLAAALATAVYFPAVGILLRATGQKYALVSFAGMAVLLFSGVLVGEGRRISFWHFAAFFGAGVSLVVFSYGAVLKSLSLDILIELSRTEAKRLSLDEITQHVVRPAYSSRAQLLVDWGAAGCDAVGNYFISSQGRRTAKRVESARRYLRLKSPGLYSS
jgi:hypothetical protein